MKTTYRLDNKKDHEESFGGVDRSGAHQEND